MQIADFPRPPEDNGRGVHWSARIYHPSGRDLDFWINELVAMHIKWVKLLDDGDGSSLELCRRLIDAGIMPVVRLFREQPNPDRMGGREISGVRKLVAAGVRYLETNNEPDLPAEWKDNHKPANWLDIVTDNFIFDANIVFNEGGLLAVPAMGPGGKDNIIRRIADKGRADLFDRGAWLAIHNYTLNHPPDYPDDPVNQEGRPLTREEYERFPAWAWDNRSMEMINERRARDKNPGQTLDDDANCFRGWERAGKVVHDVLGRYIPVISTEGGPVVGWGDDLRYPKVIPSQQAEWQVDMVRFMQEKAPAWYFSCCTWLLASRPLGDWSPTWDQMSWYTDAWNERFGLAGRLPVVQALKDLPPRVRPELRRGSATLTLIVQRATRNEPIAGLNVEIEATAAGDAAPQRFTEVTDAQGRLTLDRRPAAAYRLLIFGVEVGQVTLGQDDRKTLTLRPQVGRRSRVLGRIVDGNGAPQADLPVILQQASPLRLLAETRTDGDGRYVFDALPAAKLRLRVAPGTSQSTEQRNIAVDGWADATVDLSVPSAAVQQYAVTTKRLLSPAETGNDNIIFGRVLDEQGNALDGVTVRLRWTGAAPDTNFPTVKSGQDQFKPRGYFQFIHTPGVFMVDVVDPDYQSQTADNLITADMPNRPRPIAYEVIFQRKSSAPVTNQSSVRGRIVGAPSTASPVTLSGAGVTPKLARLRRRRQLSASATCLQASTSLGWTAWASSLPTSRWTASAEL
ncbi:MAG: carboxypeptidase-like regulatory domain-containing protein [Caldilineaceae bacterium]